MTASGATRFTDELREASDATWSAAIEHRFVREIARGDVPAEVMTGYLVQDQRFLDGFLVLLGGAMGAAESYEARLRLADLAGGVRAAEHDYFERVYSECGADPARRAATPDYPATRGFNAIFREAAATGSYAVMCSVMLVSYWLYNDWARPLAERLPADPIQAEWIHLHEYPPFAELVDFFRGEVDRVGPGDAERAHDFFARTVQLELDFFDEAYEHPFRP